MYQFGFWVDILVRGLAVKILLSEAISRVRGRLSAYLRAAVARTESEPRFELIGAWMDASQVLVECETLDRVRRFSFGF